MGLAIGMVGSNKTSPWGLLSRSACTIAKPFQVLTGSLDKSAKIWDVVTGKQIGPAWPHTGGVWDASSRADSSMVALPSPAGVRVFECPPVSLASSSSLTRFQLWLGMITGSELDHSAGGRIRSRKGDVGNRATAGHRFGRIFSPLLASFHCRFIRPSL